MAGLGGRLRPPVCAFVIAYGVARTAELADWSRLHHDAAALLGLGHGPAAWSLLAGKGAELVLTVLAVLALIRHGRRLLLAALAGWTADLALLTVVEQPSGVPVHRGDHGLSALAFAGLLAVTYRLGDPPGGAAETTGRTRIDLHAPEPGATRHDLSADADRTRQDLPARGPAVTRQDLPVRPPRESDRP